MRFSPSMYVCRLLSFLLILTLTINPAVAETVMGTSAEELGVSSYKHFIIYPHLDKALKAQINNNETIALREFEHIHELAPDSIPLIIYLAEAYRHFDKDELARELLQKHLRNHPNDARLQRQLGALPVIVEPVHTLAQLQQQQLRCDAEPNTACRSTLGQNALRLGALDIVQQQLSDPDFKAQPQAQELREGLIQRAIYLQQWVVLDQVFSQIYTQDLRTLSPLEQSQWFNALILGRLDSRLLALQSQGLFNSTDDKISYASSLLERKELARLEHYLVNNEPKFTTAEQEKSWLYLLSKYHANPYRALAYYTPVFKENLDFVIGETLPVALKSGDAATAQHILKALPQNKYLAERYTVSLERDDQQEALRVTAELYKQNPTDLKYLDQLTWRLLESGQNAEAVRLLINRYPFATHTSLAQSMMLRMSEILVKAPNLITEEQKKRLLRPLATADQRQFQSTLSWFAGNCPAQKELLGDLSSHYSAETWKRLAGCYRDELPGLALFAYQQAVMREPNAFNQRAVAYQAYQVKDYKEALRAWQAVKTSSMNNDELRSATHTAQEALDTQARDLWLAEQKKRGMDNTEHYWWLHAQRYLPEQPDMALADFNRAIAAELTVRAYTSRSAIYRQQEKLDEAVEDLRQSLLIEPENRELQAALGYALWDKGEWALSREAHELALTAMPDDQSLNKQFTYVNERLNDVPRTQHYARHVIDDLSGVSQLQPLSSEQNQELFDFRRLHESVARRLSFSFDLSIGLNSESVGYAGNNLASAADLASVETETKKNRSYRQMELDYRLGRNLLIDGDSLSLYGRIIADSGTTGQALPTKNSHLGVGVRWKPLRDSTFFVSLEKLRPFKNEATTLLRLSASLLNNGRFSDEWHPNGKGWLAHNLYLDAAHYMRKDNQAWTADYRFSWHQKIKQGQTLEPYVRLQANGARVEHNSTGNQLAGLGVRWNIWLGGTHYDAWPHKISLGLEYQRNVKAINYRRGKRDNTFFTLGVSW